MTDEDLSYIGAADALEAFRARRLSPVELMHAVIARAEATEPAVNALSARYFDEALAAARTAEAAYGGGGVPPPRPLEGLPFAAKDAFPIAGRTTTSGSLLYRDRIDTVTAPGTQRILDAGAILHARTATPEFCAVAFTQSRLWGITRSPWNLDCAAGGSSGGAGAALAAGSTIIADGTDVGGSIRIPASMCGVVGYKPPYGRVPLLPELMLDAYVAHGPMGRSVDDCALMLDVMAGPHPMDMTSLADRVTLSGGARDVAGWRIAFSPDLGCFDVDPEIAAAIAAAAGTFEALGARVERIDLPWSRDDIIQATATHFQHYFGNWIANETATAPALVNDYVHFFIDTTRALALPSLEAGMALEARLAGIFAQQMQSYDLFICPTVPLTGLQAGESWVTAQPVIAGRAQPSEYHWCMTELFNILNRYPVISLPCGAAENGMPVGLSLVGGAYRDAAVFTAAHAFEDARGCGYRTPASRPRIGALIN